LRLAAETEKVYMINKEIFKKPKNRLEGEAAQQTPQIKPEEQSLKCDDCSKEIKEARLKETLYVCPFCGYHFSLSARQRIDLTFDEGSFAELFGDFETKNILGFPNTTKNYCGKGKNQGKRVCNLRKGTICGITVCAFVMEGQS
jgi:acetyl-CoA carboxylase carboxyl transferase subunit beta